MLLQKLSKQSITSIEKAQVYFSILATLNSIHLTPRQIQLLAFTATRGTISSPSSKEEFCKQFKSTVATVNNMVCELTEMGLLEKSKNKTKVNHHITLNFESEITLQIALNNG